MTTRGIVGQFLSLRKETDVDLLTMRCGDFYEFFIDNAEAVGREFDLKVSQKSSRGSSYPMVGVPLNDPTPYLRALVERGYRAAIVDQYETESGNPRREVKRTVAPGMLLETSRADAQFLAAVVIDGDGVDLAFSDITTDQFLVTEATTIDDATAELYRFAPVEVLPGPELRSDDETLSRLRETTGASFSLFATETLAPGHTRHVVHEQFGASAVDSVGLDSDLATRVVGGVLAYIEEMGVGVPRSMARLQVYYPSDLLEPDTTTQRNLELMETMHGNRPGSLFGTINHTVTLPSGYLLREWSTQPRRDRGELIRRHDVVESLASAALAHERAREVFDGAHDLKRPASRSASGGTGVSELLSVRDTLSVLPAPVDATGRTELTGSPLARVIPRPG